MQAVENGTKREATLPPSASAILGLDDRSTRRRDDALIELDHVTKRFLTPRGDVFTALRDVNLVVEPGQFCAIVGPTGCGKSTTLTLVAGLDRPSAGEIRVGGTVVDGIANGIIRYLNEHDRNDGGSLLPPEFKTQRPLDPAGLDVRAAPSDKAKLLKHVDADGRLFVFQERDGWYQVFVRGESRANQSRAIGWVRKGQVTATNDPPPPPPPETDS